MKRASYRVLAIVGACALSARAQTTPPPNSAAELTLPQAVERASQNYPAIRVSQEQLNAAAAGIRLARTAYLPRVDALAQVNRATRNNVFGLLLPNSVIPSMSGPVIGSNNFGTAWGSAVGGLVSWEPFDFGLRGAGVDAAAAIRAQSEAALKRTRFEVSTVTADAFLTVVAAGETVKAAQASVDRAETVLRTINALVKAELRPGADGSRAEAELAAARTQLIQAQQAADVARAAISQFVGIDPAQIRIAAPGLQRSPPEQSVATPNTAANPVAQEQAATVDQARAQFRVLERSYFPRFYLQGSAYARGTGAELNGSLLGGVNGLAPNVQNYALGFTVTFPVSNVAAIHAQEAVQAATIQAQNAKSQQIAAELRAQWNTAVANLRGARAVAGNTPVQVGSARAALQQATARYESGLGNITEVADAQRLLTQAEIDDALARLSVWRGLLGLASVAGDLQPFLAEVAQ
jgi:outer membrane protein